MQRSLAFVCCLLVPLSAAAQELPTLDAAHPLTLRPTEATRQLAERVRATLALRLDVAVSVGEDAPPEILEAVPEGHVGVGRDGDAVRLVLAGPEGQVFRSDVDVGDARGRDAARAVALAVEALRDAALDGPPEGSANWRTYVVSGREVTWIYRERPGGLYGPAPVIEAHAKPLVALGFLAGVSTERLTALLGPRLGLGLCLEGQCVVLEGDLPLLPDESESCDGRRIQYRPVTLALRVQLRPIQADDLSLAFGLGILSRFGLANLVGVDVSRITTSFGLRGGVEGAWRFAGPLELVLEAGVDLAVSPATFTRRTRPPPGVSCTTIETLLVEDLVTVWGQLAIRLRP